MTVHGLNNRDRDEPIMSGKDPARKHPADDAQQLDARLAGLEEQEAALRNACAGASERALELTRAATRIRAEARALRGAVLRVRLPRDPSSGASARRLLEEYLAGHGDEVVADAKTVTTELINNAYRHGEGAIELLVRQHRTCIRIEVTDEGSTGAVRVTRGKGRRGLQIVDALSLRCGVYAGSTHVWAELPIAPQGRRPPRPFIARLSGPD
jgi:hypothetical protein